MESDCIQTDCNGFSLELYPAGEDESEEDNIAVYLHSDSSVDYIEVWHSVDIPAKFDISIKTNGGVTVESRSRDVNFNFTKDDHTHGFVSFMKRSDILDESKNILKDGALFIDVLVQVKAISMSKISPEICCSC